MVECPQNVKTTKLGSDFTSAIINGVNGLLTNQMRLIYPINQSDALDISDEPIRCV